MATHPLGPGTCNLSVNISKRLRSALGRSAFSLDISTGEFCRRLFAAAAKFVTVVRVARYALMADREALNLLRSAQLPNSPGGVMITPAEAKQIEEAVERSEKRDEQLAGAASVEGLA